jgi:diguanylate cyclase (GGDEF)-like protein/PAS domain S-box-containing protein
LTLAALVFVASGAGLWVGQNTLATHRQTLDRVQGWTIRVNHYVALRDALAEVIADGTAERTTDHTGRALAHLVDDERHLRRTTDEVRSELHRALDPGAARPFLDDVTRIERQIAEVFGALRQELASAQRGDGDKTVLQEDLLVDRALRQANLAITSMTTRARACELELLTQQIASAGKLQHWQWATAGGLMLLVALALLHTWRQARATTQARDQREQATTQLRRSEQQLQAVLSNATVSICVIDKQGRYLLSNPAHCRALGIAPGAAIGKTVSDIWPAGEARRILDISRAVLTTGNAMELECILPRPDGERHLLTISFPLIDAADKPYAVCSMATDITTRKTMENELRLSARTDRLTGLPNRALFCDRLQQAILRSKRLKDYHFAVLFLDFDRFKTVNDSLGHEVGDLLLRGIAQRLRSVVRPSDSLSRQARERTTARLGGDEFVILLDGIATPEDATVVADRLLGCFVQPHLIGNHEVYATASIGIVTSAMSAGNADDVLRDADTAMYEAKLAGKGQYVLFDVSMRQRVQYRVNLESDLRNALDAGQLFLMYQPIVSLQSGRIESFEALIRWQHPEHGLISPGEFIPIAEETGLILPIGTWVLLEACTQFAQWQQVMGAAAPRSISVNLSRRQLALPGLPQTIRRILGHTHVTPGSLHLEVTESAVMKDVAAATKMLRAIKDLGVKLDMDDFGTGYSSLACLHQFPIDVLKIDRSFVANLNRGRHFAALVHAVAQLARNLNVSVIAEGIETAEQLLTLQSMECEFGQGYFFSKPLMADQVAAFKVRSGSLPGQAA